MYNNFNNAPGVGYAAPKQPKKIVMTNPAMTNPENRKILSSKNNAFSLKFEPYEIAAAQCTHKNPETGEFMTVPNADGTVTCKYCHCTINPDVIDSNEAKRITNEFINLLQTCKLLSIDMSDTAIAQIYQIIPLITKIPQIFDMAANAYNQYTSQYNNAFVQQGTGINYNNLYNTMMNGGAMSFGPAYYQTPQTPFMNQQQMTMPGGMGMGLYADQTVPMGGYPQQNAGMGMPYMNQPVPPTPAPNPAVPVPSTPAPAPVVPDQTAAAPTATIEQQVKL